MIFINETFGHLYTAKVLKPVHMTCLFNRSINRIGSPSDENKKSRIYGTSDLSIYLSALLKLGSGCSRERMRERIGRGFPPKSPPKSPPFTIEKMNFELLNILFFLLSTVCISPPASAPYPLPRASAPSINIEKNTSYLYQI